MSVKRTRLFARRVDGWDSWKAALQTPGALEPLAEAIFAREGCGRGLLIRLHATNAVFRRGEYVLKVYVPREAGFSPEADSARERAGMQGARAAGLRVPREAAFGVFCDRYDFFYLITEAIEGRELSRGLPDMTWTQREAAGAALRAAIDALHKSAVRIGGENMARASLDNERWNAFSPAFNAERRAYVSGLEGLKSVFCHGDVNGRNALVCPDGRLALIDFGDCCDAPAWYDHAAAFGTLGADPAFFRGYFQDGVDVEKCLQGLLIGDFGADWILARFGVVPSLARLRAQIAGASGKG